MRGERGFVPCRLVLGIGLLAVGVAAPSLLAFGILSETITPRPGARCLLVAAPSGERFLALKVVRYRMTGSVELTLPGPYEYPPQWKTCAQDCDARYPDEPSPRAARPQPTPEPRRSPAGTGLGNVDVERLSAAIREVMREPLPLPLNPERDACRHRCDEQYPGKYTPGRRVELRGYEMIAEAATCLCGSTQRCTDR